MIIKHQLCLFVGILCLVLLGASCVVTPVPEPPNIDPDPPNIELIETETMPSIVYNTVMVRGGPGSAEPGARVWSVNLDDPMAPAPDESPVEDDGSFEVVLNGNDGDHLRLQVRRDDLRSAPLDVVVRDRNTPTPVDRETCMEIDPPLEIALGEALIDDTVTGAITISNHCTGELTIDALSFRREEPGLALLTVPPLTIPPEGTTQVEVSCTQEAGGLVEDILFIGAQVQGTSIVPGSGWPVTVYCIGL